MHCKQSADLMVDGGFEQTKCALAWCGWNKYNFRQEYVPAWIPQPQIEVGRGTVYTNVMGNSWVT